MIGAVYGLQAVIFILKREFMLVGWMVVYIISSVVIMTYPHSWLISTFYRYPVYSFFLPIYSFWRMDDFSWGNTRLVIGEGNNKKVVLNDDLKFDESMIPLKKFSGMMTVCVPRRKLTTKARRIRSRGVGDHHRPA